MKTVTINGAEYTLGSIKSGVGRKMQDKYPDASERNVAWIAESLKSGGFAESTPQWVDENVDWFMFNDLLIAAFEASGFKTETPKVGEEVPPVEAVA